MKQNRFELIKATALNQAEGITWYKEQTNHLEIAIVDDDQDILSFLRHYLTKNLNCSLWLSKTPQSFINTIKKKHIDLCIIDINLKNKLNGLDVAEITKQACLFDIPILFISGENFKLQEELSKVLNKTSFLHKNNLRRDLIEKISNII